MTKLIVMLMLLSVCAYAQKEIVITVNTDTNGVGTTTQAKLTGVVDTIHASVVGGTVTGTVAIAYTPSRMSAVNLATNAVVASKTWRPRVDATDVAGAALDGDDPVPYVLFANDVTVSVTGAPASSVWNAVIILK